MNDFNHTAMDAMTKISDVENRSVARRDEPMALTPAQLGDRAIIPYADGANRHLVDSFRELRTRLLATSNDNFITLVAPTMERTSMLAHV